jgi:hypothetical protein
LGTKECFLRHMDPPLEKEEEERREEGKRKEWREKGKKEKEKREDGLKLFNRICYLLLIG